MKRISMVLFALVFANGLAFAEDKNDMTIVGKVIRIQEAKVEKRPEDDPCWTYAIVKVEKVIEQPSDGNIKEGDEFRVMFPANKDEGWSDLPKFKIGDEGTWHLLRHPAEKDLGISRTKSDFIPKKSDKK